MLLFSRHNTHIQRKPLPLTTVELQKAGSRLLKLAPKAVLDACHTFFVAEPVSHDARLPRNCTTKAFYPTLVPKPTNSTRNSIS